MKRTGHRVIWKFPIPLQDEITIEMPACAKLLCVQKQGEGEYAASYL